MAAILGVFFLATVVLPIMKKEKNMASHMKKLERWFTEELALVGDKVKALEDKVEEERKEAAEQRKRLEEAQTKKTSSSGIRSFTRAIFLKHNFHYFVIIRVTNKNGV
ncbi:hypothetical protein Bca101_029497 [Brassica carinata]